MVEELKGCRLINGYGPTENTTFSCCHHVTAPYESSVPIGRPITNTQVYVVDEELNQVPVGVVGELYLGGEGLARGYCGRAGQTAERFVPDWLSGESGRRLYRSGDLVRYRSDGQLEFLGRADQQVKVRGYRIEVAEVEAALREHEAVAQVAVAVQESGGAKRLVAYLVAGAEGGGSSSELRRYLEERLPEYMVPSVYEWLEQLPLLPNGKVDRKGLPALSGRRPELESGYEAARTAEEATLAGIWEQVLGVERVGIHDNFFELGGDSILSLQIVARAHEAGVRVTAKDVFQHQTVARLAAASVRAEAPEVWAEQGEVRGRVPLTPIQQWFFEQEVGEVEHWNQAVLLEVEEGELAAWQWRQLIGELLWQHDALRLRYRRAAGGWEQEQAGVAEAVPLTVVELSEIEGAEGRQAALAEVAEWGQRSLNLAQGPVLRVLQVKLGRGERGRLLLIIHHLVVDGVSWRILLADLQRGYEQIRRGERLTLGAKTTSFQQWSKAQREYAQSAAVQGELEYWRQALQVAVPEFPVDKAGGANTVASTRSVVVSLSAAETQELVQRVPGVYHTQINEVLLTALVQAYCRWSGVERLLVDLEGHGREPWREELDVSRTVGWFTTIYPVVLAGGAGGMGAVLQEVKEQLRGVPQRGIGYGLLRYLSERAEVRAELAQYGRAAVSFNYLGQLDQVLEAGKGVGAAAESSGAGHSRRGRRTHQLQVNGKIAGQRLIVEWGYSEALHERERVEELAQGYVGVLRELLAHCREEGVGGYTPSDFPLARLERSELERVVASSAGLEDVYPLTPLQQGLLFHTLYEPGSGVYFEQLHCRLRGRLEERAFRAAWEQVVARHGILRTTFVWEGVRQPLQVVHQNRIPHWHEV